MDLLGLALAVLKFVNLLMGLIGRERAKQDGRNEVIAEIAMAIARRAATKKTIQEMVNEMSDDEVDAALRDLEPGRVPPTR